MVTATHMSVVIADAGEASAIHLAGQLSGVLLIIDDRAGRAEARARHLRFTGTAAVVGLAKLKGLIPTARPILYALRDSGYRLSDVVIQSVLDDVGEYLTTPPNLQPNPAVKKALTADSAKE
jgi:predicted nucleic acid-binding protein